MGSKVKDFQNFQQVLSAQRSDSFLKMELDSARLKTLIARACVSKGLRIDIINATHIAREARGIIINTLTPTMANRLKQIQPTIEKTLFDAGITEPILAIRSGKVTLLTQSTPYPKDEPRIAPSYAADQVMAQAQEARDEDVKKCLERLAQALRH